MPNFTNYQVSRGDIGLLVDILHCNIEEDGRATIHGVFSLPLTTSAIDRFCVLGAFHPIHRMNGLPSGAQCCLMHTFGQRWVGKHDQP